MPLKLAMTQSTLLTLKRALNSARIETQEACTLSRRMGDETQARRLRDICELLADQLDYVDSKIARAS
jgi:hypothetical protein